MSKDQYTVHDDSTMRPGVLDIQLTYKGIKQSDFFPVVRFIGSAREFVERFVQSRNDKDKHIESVEYWVNVKADK